MPDGCGRARGAGGGRPQGLFPQVRTGRRQVGRPVFCRTRAEDRRCLRLRVLLKRAPAGTPRRFVRRVRKEARAVRRKAEAPTAVLVSAAVRQASRSGPMQGMAQGRGGKPSGACRESAGPFCRSVACSGKGRFFGAGRRTQRKATFGAEAPMSWASSTDFL